MLKKIIIRNYKQFRDFKLDLNAGMNVIVGDNDVGKSNLLEAINLALTGRLRGNPIAAELSPFLVNLDATHQYIQALRSRRPAEPPEILIEVCFDDTDDLATPKGTNNSLKESAPGVKIRISFNSDFIDEYAAYAAKPGEIAWVPTEYYQVEWTNFAGAAVTARGVPATASLIDATAIRLQNGADAYLQSIIGASLDAHERVELSARTAVSARPSAEFPQPRTSTPSWRATGVRSATANLRCPSTSPSGLGGSAASFRTSTSLYRAKTRSTAVTWRFEDRVTLLGGTR